MSESNALSKIAIVGMSCRFPGAPDPGRYWANLQAGVESITPLGLDELRANGVDPRLLNDPLYVRSGSFLEDIDLFDAEFFGLNARDADLTDPQQRVFFECCWRAL